MTHENDSPVIAGDRLFDIMLDTACDRLREKHIQYSIKRIDEMDEELRQLEKELDDFMSQ